MYGAEKGSARYASRTEISAIDEELQWFTTALNVVHSELKDDHEPGDIPMFVSFPNFAKLQTSQKDKITNIWKTFNKIRAKAKSYNQYIKESSSGQGVSSVLRSEEKLRNMSIESTKHSDILLKRQGAEKPHKLQLEIKEKEKEIENIRKDAQEQIAAMQKKLDEKEATKETTRSQMKEEAKKTTTSLNQDDLLRGSDSFSSMDGTQVKQESNSKSTLLNQDEIVLGSDSFRSMDGLMGAQLHVSDEDIAALSDANRPTKIAERFSQLYDDMWTDAFQVQTDRFKRSEKEAATRLLEMLKDAHQFCVETAELHTNKVLGELLTFGNDSKRNTSSSGMPLNIHVLSESQRKHFHELRRLTVDYTIERLQDIFFAHITKEKKYDMRESPPYLEKCVELCWYMVLQDPPIQIQFEPTTQPGSPFRPEEYRFYTKSGKKLAYVVWPPLRLKKGGELLTKGVAQPV